MKKKAVFFIILISSLSLVSLVIIQLFWINNAFDLAEKQFDHRVNVSLNETIAEMERLLPEIECCPQKLSENENECKLFFVVDVKLLDSLLSKYIQYNRLDLRYEYRIVRTNSDSVVFNTDSGQEVDFSHPYKICLSCLYQQEIYHLEVYFPFKKRFIIFEMGIWLGASIFFLFVVIIGFSLIIYHTIKQKKISQVKDDFINNMTHEFQTPISTISLASEVLLKSSSNQGKELVEQYAKIIYDENFRLRTHVERVLQLALIENGELRIEYTIFDLHTLIQDTIRNLCLEHCDKEVKIEYSLEANPSLISGDVLHLTNVITNIVDNAVKYSGEEPALWISTRNHNYGFMITFVDNGPGIPQSKHKAIFEKFNRLLKGNIHNVKGFGLGLYYVKTMVEAHGGLIQVSNEPGKGSRFDIYLPEGRINNTQV